MSEVLFRPNTDRPNASSLSQKLCLALCRVFSTGRLKAYGLRQRAIGGRFESAEQYVNDRVSNVEAYRDAFGTFCRFRGKTVMELGCSSGYLLAAFRNQEEFNAIGAELDPIPLRKARVTYGDRIQFIQSTVSTVPLPDESIDVIYCVDTVEHLSRPREMLLDCFRILRPGGRLLIHWHPWLGPYGSHLEDIIPFPWAHAVFSMDTLLRVAAELYDSPEYRPACYWFDEETGKRRANPYLDRQRWKEFLNRMTVRQFRRLLKELPFRVVAFQRLGFGGKAYKAARVFRSLAQVPLADEFFLKAVVCVLQKPPI